jgi:hypothetical protein
LLIAPEIAAGVGIDMPVYVFRREDKQWRLVLSDNGASAYDVVSSDHELLCRGPMPAGIGSLLSPISPERSMVACIASL